MQRTAYVRTAKSFTVWVLLSISAFSHGHSGDFMWLPGKEPDYRKPKSTLSGLPRSFVDRQDDTPWPSVHFFYVLPSDGVDEQLDVDGQIATSVEAFVGWLASQTPNRTLRVDRFQGVPDVTFFRLSETDTEMLAKDPGIHFAIEAELRAHNLVDDNKIYGIYYGGSSHHACGGSSWPPSGPGNMAAMYLKATLPGGGCASSSTVGASLENPGYWEFAMVHDLTHVQGVVPTCAPHYSTAYPAHVSDYPNDLMWSGNGHWILPPTLDIGRDDYYQAHIPNCLDLDRSPFLTGNEPVAGTGRIVFNPWGQVQLSGISFDGTTLSNPQQDVIIQLGNRPVTYPDLASSAFSLVIDINGISVPAGHTLTVRSSLPGQRVKLIDGSGAATVLAGIIKTEGTGSNPPPELEIENPSGITIPSGGVVSAPSGLLFNTLNGGSSSAQALVNNGLVDGGTYLELIAGSITGGGSFRGNNVVVATSGNANNPVNGAHFLQNGLQLYPSSGGTIALTINDFGATPQYLNITINGNGTVSMPSVWPVGFNLPNNNLPVVDTIRPAGTLEPSFGGGSMIVQATGDLTLNSGSSGDFVFPGGIVLKAGGNLNLNGVVLNQGWTTAGRAFQGVFFESPNVVSPSTIQVLSNSLNWVNFSTLPTAHARVWTLVQMPDGSSQYAPADTTAPHQNTYSVLIEAAANGQCWVCLVNTAPINVQ